MTARVPYVNKASLAPQHKDLLNKHYTSFAALANSPECMRAFWSAGAYFQNASPLSPRLRELVLLEIGRTSGCLYEWTHHVKIALACGVTPDEVHLVASSRGADITSFNPLTRCALRMTREMYTGLLASTETIEELKQHLDSKLVTELVTLAGYYCGMVRVLSTLGVEIEPDYAEYITQFPLPTRVGEVVIAAPSSY